MLRVMMDFELTSDCMPIPQHCLEHDTSRAGDVRARRFRSGNFCRLRDSLRTHFDAYVWPTRTQSSPGFGRVAELFVLVH